MLVEFSSSVDEKAGHAVHVETCHWFENGWYVPRPHRMRAPAVHQWPGSQSKQSSCEVSMGLSPYVPSLHVDSDELAVEQ